MSEIKMQTDNKVLEWGDWLRHSLLFLYLIICLHCNKYYKITVIYLHNAFIDGWMRDTASATCSYLVTAFIKSAWSTVGWQGCITPKRNSKIPIHFPLNCLYWCGWCYYFVGFVFLFNLHRFNAWLSIYEFPQKDR